MEREQSILSDYVSSMGAAPTTTFGELLRENLQEKLNRGVSPPPLPTDPLLDSPAVG